MSDIFISYASQDRARIKPLVDALEQLGWSVFWDTKLLPGEVWHKKIASALASARCVVVLWSQASIESHWVFEEASSGGSRGILVPALLDKVEIPLGFQSLQAANLVGWNGRLPHPEFEKITRSITAHAPLARAAAASASTAAAPAVITSQPKGNFITIPACTFLMGAQKTDANAPNYDPEARDDEPPVHQVTLKSFRIARFPVTVTEFAAFVDADGYAARQHWAAGGFNQFKEPEKWAEQRKNLAWPIVRVSWYEASAYCAWAGLRLPSEAEWERVARGPKGARYPWGAEPPLDHSRANYDDKVGHPTPEGQYPLGKSVEGVSDMLGNVWEWCNDWYGEYSATKQHNPAGAASGKYKILRGGSWYFSPSDVRVSIQFRVGPAYRNVTVGFRCSGELP